MLAFCMSDQWAWSWSTDWADILIKQVARKPYRTIPNCNLMVKAILLNLEPYQLITVLRHSNICHTKQTARICLCKSWHKKRLNMFRSFNTSPKPPSEMQRIISEQYGKTAVCPTQICGIYDSCVQTPQGRTTWRKEEEAPKSQHQLWSTLLFQTEIPWAEKSIDVLTQLAIMVTGS